jgi:hypothetical protein
VRYFTIPEARALLPEVQAAADRLIDLRARLTQAVHDQQSGDPTVTLADVKGLEAAMSEVIDSITAHDIQVKGFAPLLVDFPMQHDGRVLLLCWLEGETELAWYHDADHGFAGRRRISDL